jgi:hypothetical protein
MVDTSFMYPIDYKMPEPTAAVENSAVASEYPDTAEQYDPYAYLRSSAASTTDASTSEAGSTGAADEKPSKKKKKEPEEKTAEELEKEKERRERKEKKKEEKRQVRSAWLFAEIVEGGCCNCWLGAIDKGANSGFESGSEASGNAGQGHRGAAEAEQHPRQPPGR